jgi:hypothetical protein
MQMGANESLAWIVPFVAMRCSPPGPLAVNEKAPCADGVAALVAAGGPHRRSHDRRAENEKRAAVGRTRFEELEIATSENQPGRSASLKIGQTENELPQPQVDFTFGFWNLNPAPWSPST